MSQFSEYVTSTAFSLTLSRPMCDAMEFIMGESVPKTDKFRFVGNIPSLMTLHSLNRRGLVSHNDKSGWFMTEAGEALYPLLVLSGLCRSKDSIKEVFAA